MHARAVSDPDVTAVSDSTLVSTLVSTLESTLSLILYTRTVYGILVQLYVVGIRSYY